MRVSCIMPTRDRRHLIGLAISAFRNQNWPDRELVVIDDGADSVEALFADMANVVYIRLNEPYRIGAKRDIGCERATGKIFVNWDDDDWSAPNRISDQVFRLISARAQATAYHSLLFWDNANKRASRWNGNPGYGPGSTQAYRRGYWLAHRHPNASVGEDAAFMEPAQHAKSIVTAPAGRVMVARIHSGNSSRNLNWAPVERWEVPVAFLEALRCS